MNQEWRDLGNHIKNIIQDAVDSRDFKKLNQTVKGVIENAMDGVEKGISKANAQWNSYTETAFSGEKNAAEAKETVKRDSLFSERLVRSTRNGGLVLSIVGYILGIGTALAMAVLIMMSLLLGGVMGLWIAAGWISPVFIAGLVMAAKGSGRLSMVKRFRRYVGRLRGRTYCEVRELAEYVAKSRSFVVKDIRRMIKKGWFIQGHVDEQETCLIVDDATYRQYLDTMKQAELAGREETKGKTEADPAEGQVESVIRAGERYLEKIRACNDGIPGEEISGKISRMELLVRRIFDRVEKHPENIEDIRKLMEYYLPTAVKLLEAYEELLAQPVRGENIENSKKEIEGTLDTLNIAFEKLLDDMFQDTAWDVSTDISVLKTLLAQEGLAEDGFEKMKQEK